MILFPDVIWDIQIELDYLYYRKLKKAIYCMKGNFMQIVLKLSYLLLIHSSNAYIIRIEAF